MTDEDLVYMPAWRALELFRARKLSPVELMQAVIGRAEGQAASLNAFTYKYYDEAMEQARRAEARYASGAQTGALEGLPVGIKDESYIAGKPTSGGSLIMKDFISDVTSPNNERILAAGGIVHARTATPEFSSATFTWSRLWGVTRNPWNKAMTPGGSSGGSAASLAAGTSALCTGSDIGGSIRIPASACGVVGLKPSRDRLAYSEPGKAPPLQISVNHAVTISVRDSIALFRAAEVNDGTYPLLGDIQPLKRRLRIAFAPEPIAGTPLHPHTRAGLEDVAQLCRELGHTLVNYTIPMDGPKFTDAFILYWAAGAAMFTQEVGAFSGKPVGPEIVEPWTQGLSEMAARRISEMPGRIACLQAFEAQYAAFFETLDLILTPVTGSPAVPVGEQAPDGRFDEVMQSVLSFVAYTSAMNVAGAASMSVPLSWSPAGLPIGAMFSGRRGDDELLFALALELEAARPWAGRKPPICAS